MASLPLRGVREKSEAAARMLESIFGTDRDAAVDTRRPDVLLIDCADEEDSLDPARTARSR